MKQFENQEVILHQEDFKMNKPNIIIDIAINKELTTKTKQIYNSLLIKLLESDTSELIKHNSITTTISHIIRTLGIQNRSNVYDLLSNLLNTTISFNHYDNPKRKTITKLISSYDIVPSKEDSLTVRFDTSLVNELIKWNDTYTKLDILEMNDLKITHSLTLYEVFKFKISGYESQNKNYTETQLRDYLALQKKYLEPKIFNRELRKWLQEINSKTSLFIVLDKIKKFDNERVYMFKVKQSLVNDLTIQKFILKIQSYLYSNQDITIQDTYRKNKYCLTIPFTNDLNKNKNKTIEDKPMWCNDNPDSKCFWNTVKTDVAMELWKNSYITMKDNPTKWLNQNLQISLEDFLNIKILKKFESNY